MKTMKRDHLTVSTMHAKRKMSAQNVMASITRTLGTRYETNAKAPNEVRLAGEESKDKLYEPKHQQKAFRVMTVIAYLISVSLAAIILSLYYSLIWDPKDHRKFSIRQQKLNLSAKIECVNPPDSIQFVDLPRSDGVLEDEKVSYKSNDGTFLDKLKADFVEEKDENLQDVDDLTNGTPATSSSSLEQDDNDDDEDFSSDDLGNRPEFQRELSPHR